MDKGLPVHHLGQPGKPALQRRRVYFKPALAALVFASLCLSLQYDLWLTLRTSNPTVRVAFNTEDVTARCKALNVTPAPPPDFSARTQSDRYEAGTLAVLIRNATIWTGNEGGTETFTGDILLDMGLIKEIGTNVAVNDDVTIIDAEGAWVTPGIVDVHAHNGVMSSPLLAGATDTDSHKALAQPWLRSLDGMNTHDDSYALSIAGGVTTSLVLPGSDTAISGQAFTMKLRPTKERSSSSLLVAPPYGLNGSDIDYSIPPLWRHMKHACGENPSKYMSGVRMDTVWSYRDTYNKGRLLKEKQDEYCAKLLNGGSVEGLGSFPDDMQWESLVDTLRGKVKVHVHCYEAVDLDAFVRLTNEFKFPVAAFHHAHEAYLVTDLLKKAYNNTPATPMFGSFARYKREGYRHSTYAPRILHDEGIDVIMKVEYQISLADMLVWLTLANQIE
ncbi:hypothetical protein ID866_5706 [Astraeus odoratus]|nr:hypothetical protein ID866_5706 [Astraeus odoratus]